jgi:ankyrin repeat protein
MNREQGGGEKEKKKFVGSLELEDEFGKAFKDGNVSKVREFLETYDDAVEVILGGMKVLHLTVERGHVDIVKLLIQNGADVNAVDSEKCTSLHHVASTGHVTIAKLLIQSGADVNALMNGDYFNSEQNFTALHIASKYGHVGVAKVLIQNGADVNAMGLYNETSIHIAAENRHVDVVKLLIQNGGDLNAVPKFNRSALYLACSFHKSVPLTLELLCLGAHIDKKTLNYDKSGLIGKIKERMDKLRNGEHATHLYSNEEKMFMRNLKVCLVVRCKGAAFRTYNAIRSFITFYGIFMAPGYDLGNRTLWKHKI